MIKYLISLLLLVSSFCYAQDVLDEQYPSNLGPPETIFACKSVLTKMNGKDGVTRVYGCTECPLLNGKIINTCIGIKEE
jgi:hypothetical protein